MLNKGEGIFRSVFRDYDIRIDLFTRIVLKKNESLPWIMQSKRLAFILKLGSQRAMGKYLRGLTFVALEISLSLGEMLQQQRESSILKVLTFVGGTSIEGEVIIM